jgi:hypothetical protein
VLVSDTVNNCAATYRLILRLISFHLLMQRADGCISFCLSSRVLEASAALKPSAAASKNAKRSSAESARDGWACNDQSSSCAITLCLLHMDDCASTPRLIDFQHPCRVTYREGEPGKRKLLKPTTCSAQGYVDAMPLNLLFGKSFGDGFKIPKLLRK